MANPQSPGWYDDPDNPQQLRYFDGIVWTRHTSPRSTRPVSTAAQPGTPQPPGTQPDVPEQPAAPQGAQSWGQHPQHPSQPTQGQRPPGEHPYGQPGQQHGPFQGQGGWSRPPAPTVYGTRARTPDGEPLAGWWKRAAARIIDWVITWVLALPLTGYFLYRAFAELWPAVQDYANQLDAGRTGATPPTASPEMVKWLVGYSVLFTLVAIVYEVFFTTRTGATPGKKALGLKVRLREQPGPLPVQAALRRTIIPMGGNLVSSLPLVSQLVGLLQVADVLLPLVNERKQAIHDLMAKTNVVDTRKL
jgi:uncharacterized RDD family membrane protein YckC